MGIPADKLAGMLVMPREKKIQLIKQHRSKNSNVRANHLLIKLTPHFQSRFLLARFAHRFLSPFLNYKGLCGGGKESNRTRSFRKATKVV
jgi:hypothetical protein